MLNLKGIKTLKPRKVLVFDIETTDMELSVNTYSLKNHIRYFDPKTIKRDWSILGVAWKELGEERVNCISVSPQDPFNDYHVVRAFHEELQDTDTIIGHNSDKFDIRKFNARCLYYDLPPIPPRTQIDTLKIARKYFEFSSNKLSYLADFLGVSSKDQSPDWRAIMSGDRDELRKMRDYNRQDVIVTEQVYNKIMGWHATHPHIAPDLRDIEGNMIESCPKCGSGNVGKSGLRYNQKTIVQRMVCKDCGGWFNGKRTKRV